MSDKEAQDIAAKSWEINAYVERSYVRGRNAYHLSESALGYEIIFHSIYLVEQLAELLAYGDFGVAAIKDIAYKQMKLDIVKKYNQFSSYTCPRCKRVVGRDIRDIFFRWFVNLYECDKCISEHDKCMGTSYLDHTIAIKEIIEHHDRYAVKQELEIEPNLSTASNGDTKMRVAYVVFLGSLDRYDNKVATGLVDLEKDNPIMKYFKDLDPLKGVSFTAKEYEYLVETTMEISVGDLVVVPTRYLPYNLAVVSRLSEHTPARSTLYITDVVDCSSAIKREKIRKETAELEAELESRMNEMNKAHKYKQLAQFEPSLADVYEKWRKLKGYDVDGSAVIEGNKDAKG